MEDKLRNQLGYSVFLSVFNGVFPIITVTLLTNVLEKEIYGEIIYWLTICSYFSVIGQLGLPVYGVKEISKHTHQVKRRIVIQFTFISLITGFLISILFLILFDFKQIFAILSLIFILLTILSMDWLIQGLGKFKELALRNFLIKSLTLILLYVFVKNNDDNILYFIILIGGILIQLIFNLNIIQKTYNYKISEIFLLKNGWSKHIKGNLTFFSFIALSTAYTQLDSILLGELAGNKELANYSIPQRIIKATLFLTGALSNVFIVRISQKSKNEEERNKILNKSIQLTSIIGLYLTLALFFLAEEVVIFLTSTKYIESVLLLKILSPIPLIVSFSGIICFQFLSIMDENRKLFIIFSAGAIFSIGSNLLTVSEFGSLSVAIIYVLTEFLILVISLTMIKQYLKKIGISFLSLSNHIIQLITITSFIYIIEKYNIVNIVNSIVVKALALLTIYILFNFKSIKRINLSS